MIPRVETARTVWKPQPHGPVADWLGIVQKASAPRGGYFPIPGLEVLQYLYNSDNLGTKTVIPRVETALHGAEILAALPGS